MFPGNQWRRALPAIALAATLLSACGDSTSTASTTVLPATTATTAAATTTSPPATTTTTTTKPPTTTTTTVKTEVTLALSGVSKLGDAWTEVFVIGYGTDEEQLGTAPGGDNGSLQLGPEYGAQAADGTWWFLDAAKQRLAHYSDDGEYIDAVAVPTELLGGGVYFQYQLPHALDNGMIVASQLGSGLLVLEDGALSTVGLATAFAVRTDDGEALYGFGETGGLLSVDPAGGTVDQVEWFTTRAGSRYRLHAQGNLITVDLPDTAIGQVDIHLVYAGDETVPAFAGVEVNSGTDGSLFLYLYGGTDSGEGGQLAGFLTISPDGVVSPMEASRDPFSPSDPGSPAHLGVRPGSNTPWLMFVDTDGVHVFQRA